MSDSYLSYNKGNLISSTVQNHKTPKLWREKSSKDERGQKHERLPFLSLYLEHSSQFQDGWFEQATM